MTASRSTYPNTLRSSARTLSTACGRSASISAARNAARAPAISAGSDTSRYSVTVARTSDSALRVRPSTSRISSTARGMSPELSSTRRARPAFTVIVVRLWPSRSCRSRATRSRSLLTASVAISWFACSSRRIARIRLAMKNMADVTPATDPRSPDSADSRPTASSSSAASASPPRSKISAHAAGSRNARVAVT